VTRDPKRRDLRLARVRAGGARPRRAAPLRRAAALGRAAPLGASGIGAHGMSGRGIGAHLSQAFPGLLGPGRRAAWRRYCLRRALSIALILSGFAIVALGPR